MAGRTQEAPIVFDTLEFAVFFLVVFVLYYALNRPLQNRLLLAASYFFYGFWDWRFLSLIIFSTLLDYFCGRAIARSSLASRRKGLLAISIVGNLGVLGFFKYFNFFAASAATLLESFGLSPPHFVLNVVLPVGISFYTFQTLSYTIDIYRSQVRPAESLADFALFVSFFPQLVAGPIERARNLLPQISTERHLDRRQFYEGCWLVYWGVYKKVFVADNLAKIVDKTFSTLNDFSSPQILVAGYAFCVQIYCDFSGYSDIARGVAKILGFEISVNFNVPYAATNPLDFWRRWHITLSEWLRDYLYMPLLGALPSHGRLFAGLMVTMALGGLWHGAEWHFVVWGFYNGALLVAYGLIRKVKPAAKESRIWRKALSGVAMFHFTCLGMMLFRVQSVGEMGVIVKRLLYSWEFGAEMGIDLVDVLFYSSLVIIVQVFQYNTKDLLTVLRWPAMLRTTVYVAMYFAITLGGAYEGPQFIYFQF